MSNSFYDEKDYKLLYSQMMERLVKKKSDNINFVEKAFYLAEELHKTQFRHSGDPYILHPVIVATILEKLDFDTDVISAALLHDVVEDCDYTIAQIKHEFNLQIAQIVDAVTAISKSDYSENSDLLFDDENFLKPSLESQTYHKLMKIGKKNKFAFYIKFADRLHNLKTIDVVKDYKKLEKVKETERWILPLCLLLKSEFFYNEIKNQCFTIVNEKKGQHFFEECNYLQEFNEKNTNALKENLAVYANMYFAKNKTPDTLQKIVIKQELPEQIYESINNKLQIKPINNIKASHIIKVPTGNIFIITKSISEKQNLNNMLFELLEEAKTKSILKIVGFEKDNTFNYNYFIVKDNNQNLYRITMLSAHDYTTLKIGGTEGTNIDLIDEENSNEIITDYIKVKTRSGQVIEIQENSTVLDFAFKIHNEIGFSFKYAIINNSPSKQPHYIKIKKGDTINIISEKDENENLKNVAKIRWLAYVKTENAKKALIRYFERKYENQ